MTDTRTTSAMDPARAQALAATLGRTEEFARGATLPPLWHLVYFWEARPPDELGRDGHPATGGLIPDTGLPRRMWAGGQMVFHRPLRAGIAAERITRLENVTRKEGRSGKLAFVRLRHDIRQAGALSLTEYQDLVYRADPAPEARPPDPPRVEAEATVVEPLRPDSIMLFRFSALTFNGHRIHYDADYARTVEGYDGLVVHGPLLALALAGLAERQQGPLSRFGFRARSPLTLPGTAEICCSRGGLFARTPEGRLLMEAEAS